MSRDFLVELGTEELPPKALAGLITAFAEGVVAQLRERQLAFDHYQAYGTPRRLAVLVHNLAESTPVTQVTTWGPPVAVALDEDGRFTRAALAFAAKNGVEPTALATDNDGKVDKLVYRTAAGGEATAQLLAAVVEAALNKLPMARPMRWGAGRHEFIRPVHWLLMLYGEAVGDASFMGLRANRSTRGHRFHCNRAVELQNPAEYDDKLKDHAWVIADYAERKAVIRAQVMAAAAKQEATAVIDEDLLDEVTALVEWPVACTGRFDERFLNVPAEALVSAMKVHQKCFHLVDAAGKLMPYFIAVANIDSRDPAQVVDGNERVIRPRLADAAFFFAADQKTSLVSKREQLHAIVFQAQLGTVFAKTERIAGLAAVIARTLGSDAAPVVRAGQLCKADLVSDMVLEFADMQGIAGYYYARHDGEPEAVARGIKEHYLPRFAGDDLPASATGALVALADRLDTLVGIFGIGQQPTGSKDPFALRRASLGVLRILIEQRRELDLKMLLSAALKQYPPLPQGQVVVEQVLAYMLERLRAWYQEQGIAAAVVQAVSAKGLSHPLDIDRRVRAVNHFRQLPEANALAAANKRVGNILSKVAGPVAETVDSALLQEDAEKALAEAVVQRQSAVAPLFAAREYQRALTELASLRERVDTFFDQVMVMSDNEALKNNRLALLRQLRGLFLEVADISNLAVSG